MYSLIISVRSITAVARLCMKEINVHLNGYLKLLAQLQADDDYSIPSLIWPPPNPYSMEVIV